MVWKERHAIEVLVGRSRVNEKGSGQPNALSDDAVVRVSTLMPCYSNNDVLLEEIPLL